MYKIYALTVAFILALTIQIGFLIPNLISARSDMSVLVGVIWIVSLPIQIFVFLKEMKKMHDEA